MDNNQHLISERKVSKHGQPSGKIQIPEDEDTMLDEEIRKYIAENVSTEFDHEMNTSSNEDQLALDDNQHLISGRKGN